MITPKTPKELVAMREGGKLLGAIRDSLMEESVVGTSLLDIEKYAIDRIQKAGGTPSFVTVEDYQFATCLCVNEEVVHAMPREYRLKDGDMYTLDIGMIYKGMHTDTAWTKIIHSPGSKVDPEKERFLEVGKQTLLEAIAAALAGNYIGDISSAIQRGIEGAGYSIVASLTGHGVGHELHEEPLIPGFVRGNIKRTPLLVPGMTLAIEIIYSKGKGSIEYAGNDDWTLSTQDRSYSAVFERTIEVTEGSPLVLTT